MSDFTLTLPSEITTSIFSYLDLLDYAECVCVCRHWYHCVPDYATQWHQFHVSPDTLGKASNGMIQCLGPHIHEARIHKADTIAVLRALAERKCGLTLLEIKAHAHPIKNDGQELFGDSMELISAMEPFASTLTELIITDHPFDMPTLHLLHTLPKLTHLTLRFDFKRLTRVSMTDDSDIDKEFESNLVYLDLACSYYYVNRVLPVLRRSPKLKALLLAKRNHSWTYQYCFNIDFDTVFELCPDLRYLMRNMAMPYDVEIERRSLIWKKLAKHPDNRTANGALRELIFDGDNRDLDRWMVPMLTKSQDTLQYLNISRYEWDHWSPPENITLHQLKTVNISCSRSGGCRWFNAFIANHRAVQDLDLSVSVYSMEVVDQLILAISSMNSLRRLRIRNRDGKHLQGHLHICRNLALLSQNRQLRSVHFDSIPFSDQGLSDLCDIPLLHELTLCVNLRNSRLITADGYLRFAEKLRLLDSRLHTLSFENCFHVNDQVLEQLADVKSLSVLSITRNRRITDAGLQRFVNSGQGEKKVHVHGCKFVSRMGLWEKD